MTKALSRLILFLAVAAFTACGEDSNSNDQSDVGLGLNTPIQWVNPSSGGTIGGGTAGDTPMQWIHPNNAVGGSGGVFIISQDEVFYDAPTLYQPVHHPLMTATADSVITNPELNAMAMINSIRQNLNGGGGGGVVNGGIVGGANIPQLLFSEPLRKSARAHCKHFVLFHGTTAFATQDPEGNTFTTGGPDPQGRLRKGGVVFSGNVVQDVLADPAWTNAGNVGREFANRNPAAVGDPGMRYQGVGHWRGGQFQWYWALLIVANVN